MNTISFMTANFVARQLGYNMTEGWGQGDKATNDYFRPAATFPARFEEYLKDIRAMGFEAMDIWLAVMHPSWVTDAHIEAATDLLKRYRLPVCSLAGWFGGTPEEFEATCELAAALNVTILGGNTGLLENDRDYLTATLQKYGLRLGVENHPEKNPAELLAKIGDGANGVVGATVDTGWFGTHGYPADRALEELAGHLVHVHLKDVVAPGGHVTCRFGEGCVNIESCAKTLKRIGYTGAISLEHEPDNQDPTEDVIISLALLKEWLA